VASSSARTRRTSSVTASNRSRKSGCASFDDFARKAREPGGAALHDAVIAAITTGETSFFRDGHPLKQSAFTCYAPD
jgi:chemotaxis methyl-accepting protein methylase